MVDKLERSFITAGQIIDFLCGNYVRARQNRRMVRLKQNILGYLFIEALVRRWPHGEPLPDYLIGTLPFVGKREKRGLSGFQEVKE